MTIINSLSENNKWFIFRDNSQEVTIYTEKGKIRHTTHILDKLEKEEIEKRCEKKPFVKKKPRRKSNGRYEQDFKEEVILEWKNSLKSMDEISREYGVSVCAIRKWAEKLERK